MDYEIERRFRALEEENRTLDRELRELIQDNAEWASHHEDEINAIKEEVIELSLNLATHAAREKHEPLFESHKPVIEFGKVTVMSRL